MLASPQNERTVTIALSRCVAIWIFAIGPWNFDVRHTDIRERERRGLSTCAHGTARSQWKVEPTVANYLVIHCSPFAQDMSCLVGHSFSVQS